MTQRMLITDDAEFTAGEPRAIKVSRKALQGALIRHFPMRLSGSPGIPVRSVRIHDWLAKLNTGTYGQVMTAAVAAGARRVVNSGPKRLFTTYSPVHKGS
jgi:hypothetical protein